MSLFSVQSTVCKPESRSRIHLDCTRHDLLAIRRATTIRQLKTNRNCIIHHLSKVLHFRDTRSVESGASSGGA
jgi:hypothetical protein